MIQTDLTGAEKVMVGELRPGDMVLISRTNHSGNFQLLACSRTKQSHSPALWRDWACVLKAHKQMLRLPNTLEEVGKPDDQIPTLMFYRIYVLGERGFATCFSDYEVWARKAPRDG